MKIVIQRVSRAAVTVADSVVGKIGPGILVLLGLEAGDEARLDKMADKILKLRLWPDDQQKQFSLNVREIKGRVLVVSQFTLMANLKKGSRPDFGQALPAAAARVLYDKFIEGLRSRYDHVETGQFQAMMQVELVNDGPVTLIS